MAIMHFDDVALCVLCACISVIIQ